MRISVPTIPVLSVPSNVPRISRERAIERLAGFLAGSGGTTLLTGAGVSVDSGVRAYRGKDGRYMNPNYKCVHEKRMICLVTHMGQLVQTHPCPLSSPTLHECQANHLQYHELVDTTPSGHLFRQRYWLRSYLGYPPVRDTKPNPTHYAFAALQYSGVIGQLVTQNVDGLHHRAISSVWSEEETRRRVLELHGTLFVSRQCRVPCTDCLT
jgi:NAD+-dependent protein deacetylase sirtuin 4